MTSVRVLNVDDNSAQRYALSRFLREAGYEVLEAASGQAALEIVKQQPRVVLLDVHLPDMSGFEVCRRIKEDAETAHTLVVQMSAKFVAPEDRVRGLEGGADGYVAQPFEPAEVLALVHSLLRLHDNEEERRELLRREREARQRADAARAQLEILAEASRVLSSSLDYGATLEHVAQLVVPRLADWCVIDMLGESGEFHRLRVAHADPALHALAEELRCFPPRLADDFGAGRVMRTGEGQLVRSVSPELLATEWGPPEKVEILRRLGMGSYLVVPMVNRGRCVGVISLVYAQSGRTYGDADWSLATDLARRSAIAIDNARLFREAEHAARVRDELLAVVSHDLRNPLSVILTGSTLLLRAEGQPPPTWRRQVEGIQRSAEQMRRLIQDLLDVTSVELGRLTIELGEVEGGGVVSEIVEMFAEEASRKGIQLRACRPAEPLVTLCDRGRVLQILSNLIGNAIKFTPERGQVTISVSGEGSSVRFAVSDTGPGIAPESVAMLFERLWQAAPDPRGHGLGLYIAKGLVTAHGGALDVQTALGEGTTITFTLPLASSRR